MGGFANFKVWVGVGDSISLGVSTSLEDSTSLGDSTIMFRNECLCLRFGYLFVQFLKKLDEMLSMLPVG